VAASGGSLDYHATVESTKRDLILRAFEQADQNHAAAAKLLGVHPNYLHRLIRNLDLKETTKSAAPARGSAIKNPQVRL
jgi:transcriptional regulator with GAF, ATPase, and Fis domain